MLECIFHSDPVARQIRSPTGRLAVSETMPEFYVITEATWNEYSFRVMLFFESDF